MSSETKLRTLADDATPLLEAGLKEFEVKHFQTYPQEIQLRASNCGIATAALQQWLREAHDVESQRLITRADLTVANMAKSRRVSHVILKAEGGVYLDPTYSQFHAHVGLTPLAAGLEGNAELYPNHKIAVYADPEAFAHEYAASVYAADQKGVVAGDLEVGTDGAFRGADHEVMQAFYGRLWSLASSELFPLEGQKPHFQAKAQTIAQYMLQRTK